MAARILVLDDDQSILEVYRLILETEGYDVSLAERAYESIIDVERLHPDLIILDLKMHKQNEGWHFLQKLKNSPSTTFIPLILCTASLLDEEQERYTQERGIPIVYKPFDVDNLLHVVYQMLPQQRAS
ncbi:MAG: hypothetical protein PVS3B1_17490 [Ktedonobacteraceae bacterium]